MSKTASIKIQSSAVIIDETVYENIVFSLLKTGWRINSENGILFMHNGTYDLENVAVSELSYVLKLIGASIANNTPCFIKLFRDENIGIEVTYLDHDSLMFSLTDGVVSLKSVNVVDFSYYIDQLSSVFEIVDINRLVCIFD